MPSTSNVNLLRLISHLCMCLASVVFTVATAGSLFKFFSRMDYDDVQCRYRGNC